MNYDNPAARLLSLIVQGKQRKQTESCRTAWQHLLGVENNNPILISRLGKVMELPDLIIQAIKELYPHQDNTWTHWESQVNHAFMVQNLNDAWSTFINHIDNHSITYLQLASDLLQAKSNTKLLPNEELNALKDKLEIITNEIIDSDIPVEVKKYLSRSLRKIINSIEEYKITGALPLLDGIDATIGHVHLDHEYKNFLFNTELGKKLLDTLGAMANVVTVAVGIPQLSQAIALLAN